MAITPPSDILLGLVQPRHRHEIHPLDVASAADPASVRAATARLAKLAADPTANAEDFSRALAAAQSGTAGGFRFASDTTVSAGLASTLTPDATSAAARAVPVKKDAYQRFPRPSC